MGVRNLARSALIGVATLSLASAPAAAQSVTFSTSGSFSGGSCGSSSCSFGGFLLTWAGVTNATGILPNDVVLGDFSMACGWIVCSGGNLLAGSTFMITISQSGPSSGTGSISGSLGWNSTSGLSWAPGQGTVTIGGVTYALDESTTGCASGNTQCVPIASASSYGSQRLSNLTDDVASTTTPEPATVALMATGLVGLIPVARRRRRRA